MYSQLSESRLNAFVAELGRAAGEPFTFEVICDTLYIFTSELGALRLYHHYNKFARNPKTAVGYSENLKTHYFSLTAA